MAVTAVCHTGPRALERLAVLELTLEELDFGLRAAAGDARLCTRLDSPGAPGYIFWTRSNRYIRERKLPMSWKYSNKDLILRTIHPRGDFAITAVSGFGDVGKEAAEVLRTRHPKGRAISSLVEANNKQLELIPRNLVSPDVRRPVGEIPTWFLLYSWEEDGIRAELSLPSEMHGKAVDTWNERIILPTIQFEGLSVDIANLDQPDDDFGPEVEVEFLG